MARLAELNASYVSHVNALELRLKSDEALRKAVGGEFCAIGQLEYFLLRSRGLRDTDVVVDVGCGSGRLACQLTPLPRLHYIGCDVVPRLLAHARDLCQRPDWEFLHSDGRSIPAPDGCADFVTFFSVFTHLPQEQIFRYFREAARVLKPGGLMVMSFLEFRVPSHWANFIASVDGGRDDDHLNQYVEHDAIRAWAAAAGFEIRNFLSGDTEYIPLLQEVVFESGQVAQERGSLGQSVAVLQKRGSNEPSAPPPRAPALEAPPATSAAQPNNPFRNVSFRTRIEPGAHAILGFQVNSPSPCRVLIRAVGPGLGAFGLPNGLAAPRLELHRGEERIAERARGWGGDPELAAAFDEAGAFTLRPESEDVAIVQSLSAGDYTIIASDRADNGGDVLVEVYAL